MQKRFNSKLPTLSYYNLDKPVVIQADESDEGLGGALHKTDDYDRPRPVALTFCSISTTEQRYS